MAEKENKAQSITDAARNSNEDKGKYTIKSNSNCMVCVYAMNRHPKWGVDVECFNPERWLSDAAPSAFASFGVGKRNCIGKLFSLTAMKILLINLMKEYAISTNGVKMAVKQKLFLSSYSGHHVSLQKRR
ncbi:unnamed protein product [Diatraea saccharalis]|uniref:Cytochrome P450 n=1 Tax=Diatraea saccharalis TaxID=40085 RepID=A0A9N9WIV8_9NEOP|nr:unnamed protein product [Diatraea saccharalis]